MVLRIFLLLDRRESEDVGGYIPAVGMCPWLEIVQLSQNRIERIEGVEFVPNIGAGQQPSDVSTLRAAVKAAC